MDGKPLLPHKILVFGGEALTAAVIETIRTTGTTCRIVNHYGPTETTIGKLLHEVQAENHCDQTVPIGKPFSNTQAYILNKDMSLCPIGVPGQLYLSGDGVSPGYVKNDELTREKFVADPFYGEGKLMMYATGDKVYYQRDGNIVFIGRVDDHRVKIRGYRVEPGEIGRILEESDLVAQAIVLSREDKQGNNQLVGYIVPNGDFDRDGILEYLKAQLPDYMVPAHLVEVESMPLTANGKIDRKALPDPEGSIQEKQHVSARNETEIKLAEMWMDVLELDDIGVDDDFFELGGHSLLAVRLISAIRKGFGMELPINDIFDYPTISLLAARLSEDTSVDILPPVIAETTRPEYIPLSFSQERLWFIDRLGGSVQYNLPAVLRLKGSLKPEVLERTLRAIVNRHEVLRTVIREAEGQGYQQIILADDWTLKITDSSAYEEGTAGLSAYITGLVNRPFDLSSDYMLRADLIRFNEEDHILVVTMHHIASDGWSRSILVQEVITLYEGYSSNVEAALSPFKVQYADYAIWQQRRYMQGEVLEEKLDYWKTKLAGLATLGLPSDYSRPAIQSLRGSVLHFEIDKALSMQLQALSQQQGATLYMTLLATFNVLLYRYSGQEDICVGTTVAGRPQQELEGLIGFFVNTLALRNQVDGNMTFKTLLEEIKRTTLEAYSHQEVPFEKVVDAVVKRRDMSRHPLFQVMFSLRNTPDIPELKLGDLSLIAESQEHTTAKFDLTFMITETDSGIQGTVEYSTDLYMDETIERMIGHYTNLLGAIVSSPEEQAGRLNILSGEEEEMLRVQFNNTTADYPKEKSIVDLFVAQAALNPESIAIVFEREKLTYRELDERSNQLAHYLKKKGIGAETLRTYPCRAQCSNDGRDTGDIKGWRRLCTD